MRSRRLAQKLPLAIPVVLVILLAMLAHLQYHWSGKVSDLEEQRMEASLRRDGAHFSEDFDREVARAFHYFHPNPSVPADQRIAGIVSQYGHWMSEAPYPRLVRDVYIIRPSAGGPQLEILQPEEQRFVPTSWTPDLAAARRLVETRPPARGIGVGTITAGGIPGLMIPVTLPAPPGDHTSDPA